MDPRAIFKEAPRQPRRPIETSPATDLAKLREYKKDPTPSTQKLENAINNRWRSHYIRIFERENRR